MAENNSNTTPSTVRASNKGAMDHFADFLLNNIKSIALFVGVVIVIGGAYTFYSYWNMNQETVLQTQLAEIEAKQFELQTKIEDEKAKKENSEKSSDKKSKTIEASSKSPQDYSKDLAQIMSDYKALALKAPKSQAGKMSYIYLVDMSLKEDKTNLAQNLNDISPIIEKSLKADLVSDLTRFQLANYYTEMNNCEQANKHLASVLANKDSMALHKEARLRSALCFEKMGDVVKAKSLLEEVSNSTGSDDGFGSVQDAKKYLRYLNLSKSSTENIPESKSENK